MAGTTPMTAQPYNTDETATTPWLEARERLANADTYWLGTTRPDGRSHVVPILAVWAEDALHFAASPRSRKGRNLEHDSHCVVTSNCEGFDMVVEGVAIPVRDDTVLHHVAEAYASKYGWQVEIRDGAFHAEGAPTAGPPPYAVFTVTPQVAFAFPTAGALPPTRWQFPSPADAARSENSSLNR